MNGKRGGPDYDERLPKSARMEEDDPNEDNMDGGDEDDNEQVKNFPLWCLTAFCSLQAVSAHA